jgi:hypothetical protein
MPQKHNYKEILVSTSNMSKANLKAEEDIEADQSSKVIVPKYFSLSDKEHKLIFEIMYWGAFTGHKISK